VAIDQTGQYGHLREVNNFRVGWNRKPLAYRFNLVIADKNDLILEHRTRLRIDQASGLNRGYLGRGSCGTPQRCSQR
jgi:hypothetical protein